MTNNTIRGSIYGFISIFLTAFCTAGSILIPSFEVLWLMLCLGIGFAVMSFIKFTQLEAEIP